MSLTRGEDSAGWFGAFDEDQELFGLRRVEVDPEATPSSKQLEVTNPIGVYSLNATEFLEVGLRAVELECWRSIVYDGENPIFLIDIVRGSSGWRILCRRRGEPVRQLEEALKKAAGIAAEVDYEVRILEIPIVFAAFLWLASPGFDKGGVFIALAPLRGGEVGYQVDGFESVLRSAIKRKLERKVPKK